MCGKKQQARISHDLTTTRQQAMIIIVTVQAVTVNCIQPVKRCFTET